MRPSDAHPFSATFLTSRTTDREDADLHGNTAQATYTYATRRWFSTNQVEHYDEDFVMDTAFYNRTGFTGAWSFSEVSFYPKSSWMQRIHPFYFAKYGRDRIQDGDEDFLHTGIRFNVTRQGFLNFSHGRGHESWQGTKYKVGSDFNFFGNMQALRWLNLSRQLSAAGRRSSTTRPIRSRAARAISASRRRSSRTSTCRRISNSAATSASARPGPARSSTTSTSSTRGRRISSTSTSWCGSWRSTTARENRVLTDFLASYEFVPGTVFHVGYGSLYEKGFGSVEPVPGGKFRRSEQSLPDGQPRAVPEGVLPATVLSSRRFGARRLAERVHRNWGVFDLEDLEMLGFLRRPHDDAVAGG